MLTRGKGLRAPLWLTYTLAEHGEMLRFGLSSFHNAGRFVSSWWPGVASIHLCPIPKAETLT